MGKIIWKEDQSDHHVSWSNDLWYFSYCQIKIYRTRHTLLLNLISLTTVCYTSDDLLDPRSGSRSFYAKRTCDLKMWYEIFKWSDLSNLRLPSFVICPSLDPRRGHVVSYVEVQVICQVYKYRSLVVCRWSGLVRGSTVELINVESLSGVINRDGISSQAMQVLALIPHTVPSEATCSRGSRTSLKQKRLWNDDIKERGDK